MVFASFDVRRAVPQRIEALALQVEKTDARGGQREREGAARIGLRGYRCVGGIRRALRRHVGGIHRRAGTVHYAPVQRDIGRAKRECRQNGNREPAHRHNPSSKTSQSRAPRLDKAGVDSTRDRDYHAVEEP